MGARPGHVQRLRPDRGDGQLDARSVRPRHPGRLVGPDRTARPRDRRLRPGPRPPPGARRRGRRAVPGRRQPGPRLPRPARAHRGTLRGRPVRSAGRAPLPHRRPRPQAAGRATGLLGPRGRPGQDPRLPRRAGRDRVGAGTPRRRRPGRRRGPRGRAWRPAARRVRRHGARPRPGGRGRPRRRVARAARVDLRGAGRRRGHRGELRRLELQLRRRADPARADARVARGDDRPHPRPEAPPRARDRHRQWADPVPDRPGLRRVLGHRPLRARRRERARRGRAEPEAGREGHADGPTRARPGRAPGPPHRHRRDQLGGAVLPRRRVPDRPADPADRAALAGRAGRRRRRAQPADAATVPGRDRADPVGTDAVVARGRRGDRPRARAAARPRLLRGRRRAHRRRRRCAGQGGHHRERADPAPLRRRPPHRRR